MIVELYSVKDVKANRFYDISSVPNVAVAVRNFSGLCSESKIKDDLQLFRVGKINIETGVIEPECIFIANGSDIFES